MGPRPTNPLALLVRHRALLWPTLLDEIRQRYAGTAGGLLWVVLYPAALMGLYALVYLKVFGVRMPGVEPPVFVLHILCGLVAVMSFNEALSAGAGSLAANRNVLLNAVFPSELIALRAVLAAQGTAVVGFALAIAGGFYLGRGSWVLLLVPLFWILQILFVTGLAWVLSLASLVLRDVQQLLAFVMVALLIASPIAYTPEMAPGLLKLLVYVNPLSYFVLPLQDLIVHGRLPQPAFAAVAVALAATSSALGFLAFQRAKRAILDYV